ncbi:MAG: OmpA family protein [Prevotella sp.]|nr:OmpA family protein [Prevotella sp.]
MKKIVLGLAVCLWVGTAAAQSEGAGWDSNWFLSIKGGASAFVGKPVGHGDLFDRTQPMLNVAIGKWFSPYFGGRLSYQGLQLIDSDIEKRNYQSLHTDFLYNILGSADGSNKWDLIPYAGCGIIRNGYTHQKPFAISYGVIGRYRLSERLHLSGELGGTTTWQNFDEHGAANKLGDHLLQGSIGLSVTIGKTGFRTRKNVDYLEHDFPRIDMDNHQCDKSDIGNGKQHRRNDYSGLNSLRNRLKNKNWNGTDKVDSIHAIDSIAGSATDYLLKMGGGKSYIGAPIYFFFKIGTHELTEPAQSINIKEVANVIKKYGLHARIIGAADSQTGTAEINERLSAERANYIASLLLEQGVPEFLIQTGHRGGIDSYEPLTGNRNTRVLLYFSE